MNSQCRSLLDITVKHNRTRKTEPERLNEAAGLVAEACLRERVTLPAHPQNTAEPWTEVASGGYLPPVSCAFWNCIWHVRGDLPVTHAFARAQQEHPWDAMLRKHVLAAHGESLRKVVTPLLDEQRAEIHLYDIYLQALAVKERQGFPACGASIERRAFAYTNHVYNDAYIRFSSASPRGVAEARSNSSPVDGSLICLLEAFERTSPRQISNETTRSQAPLSHRVEVASPTSPTGL